jgi:DNA invertase Pin-like site-specific DNA recombinase
MRVTTREIFIMLEAIIYTRFSPRPNADTCDSCEKQEERCLKYLEGKVSRGGQVGVFSDPGISGDERNRPGLDEALEASSPGCLFVVDKSNRLARDVFLNLKIRYEIRKRQGNLEYADGTPPATTPEGRLYQNMLAAFDGYQLDLIRLNTKRGIARNRAMGKKINGRIPTGMMEDPGNPGYLIKNPREREGILMACCLRRHTDWGREEIATELTRNETVGPYRGHGWNGRLIDKIVARHSYWADPIDGEADQEPDYY